MESVYFMTKKYSAKTDGFVSLPAYTLPFLGFRYIILLEQKKWHLKILVKLNY